MIQRILVTVFLAAVVIGCGGDSLNRAVVNGSVSYQGQPVTDGSVLFMPCDGTVGSSIAVKIIEGRYRADTNGGIPTGSYRVKILAYRKHDGGRQLLAPALPGGSRDHDDAPQQYLPGKYNVKSQLKITVEAGAGAVTQDFALDG